ncbi:peptide ABC transporter substrate-binding protein [Actibacterium sp. EMB200-NS6]|uniref:Microcin C transport system substrate-binding protein n=2 Tax=Roseobacteraceae TaxID=2854170 RepID=A0A840C9C5_9RHOB|nr:peptide ABC transporter substrate-binding protein [Actibacterium sp. EMB200-NS6]MBB4022624.1 microcin C transport system substrate-binding protein [Actibacterium naphthalenivorans]
MTKTRTACATALVRGAHPPAPFRAALAATVLALMLLMTALAARAQDGVITSHGISTFGDLKYPADFPHLDYVNPEAPKGGEISIWGFGAFDSMNPFSTKGRAEGLSSLPYESLLAGTADETSASYGLLAESLEYPEDRRWVIFNLRPEARFSDGSPLTAEDVVFSYELFRAKGLPSYRAVLARQVESAEVLGPHRVKFTFKEDVPTRDLPQMVGGLSIFSKADYEANGRDLEENSLEPFLGSGPYVLDELDVGKRAVYRRNPDYWGADLPINIGRNNFDRIRREYYADYNAAFEGFKAGNYTFRDEASSKIWATGYNFPGVEKGWVKKAELPDGAIATGQAFLINLRRPQFQDPRVRQAIEMMFNFEWSNETLFYGIYSRVDSLWENSYLAAEGLPSPEELAILEPLAELLPEGVLDGPPVSPTVSSASRQLDRGNLRAASALLDEAGWPVGDDGIRRNAAGETLRVEFLNDSQTFDRVINPYVENLRRLGVDARMERVDSAQATNRERSYDFDIITDHLAMGYVPGNGLKQYFGSETADTSVFNKMGLKSAAVDSLIDTVIGAESSEELIVAVKALDRVLRAERFRIPQWYKDAYTVAYYDMYEHPDPLPPYALGHLDFWWYSAEKAEKLKAAGAF